MIDQTPTPTRFLKHFEDVSLFQDINLNPFDLEFRKASQNRSSKIYLTVTEVRMEFFSLVQEIFLYVGSNFNG